MSTPLTVFHFSISANKPNEVIAKIITKDDINSMTTNNETDMFISVSNKKATIHTDNSDVSKLFDEQPILIQDSSQSSDDSSVIASAGVAASNENNNSNGTTENPPSFNDATTIASVVVAASNENNNSTTKTENPPSFNDAPTIAAAVAAATTVGSLDTNKGNIVDQEPQPSVDSNNYQAIASAVVAATNTSLAVGGGTSQNVTKNNRGNSQRHLQSQNNKTRKLNL